jgi:methyl-accepting chemotaxis protein
MKMSRLAFKLLQWLIPSLLAFGALSTAVMAMLQYRQEVKNMEQSVQLIQTSFESGVELNLWNLEQASLKKQLEGMLFFPDVVRAEIIPTQGEPIAVGVDANPEYRMQKIPLQYTDLEGKVHTLGDLQISQSYAGLQERVIETVISLASSELLKVLLLGMIALLIVQRLITRHLKVIGDYASAFDVQKLHLELSLNKLVVGGKEDEIDQIRDAFEQMRLRLQLDIEARKKAELNLKEMNENLESLVEERTKELSQAFDTLKA